MELAVLSVKVLVRVAESAKVTPEAEALVTVRLHIDWEALVKDWAILPPSVTVAEPGVTVIPVKSTFPLMVVLLEPKSRTCEVEILPVALARFPLIV